MIILPSLEIVPAKFNGNILLSQIPVNGTGDFTVTRALNTATRVNSSGNIEVVNADTPRIDYLTSSGTVGCPALLVEPSGTNTLSGSVSLDTGWTAFVSNRTSGITSPSGSNDATLFQAESTAGRIRFTPTLTSGTTYTFSCFGKLGTLSSGFTLQVIDENTTTYGSGCCQAFNLNEGTLGASGNVGAGFTLQSVGMENYGSGWYRCRMTVLMGYTPTIPRIGFRIGTQLSGGRPTSVVSGTVNVWGAQLETGSVATSYIPTTTGTVTRNADVILVSGAVSGAIGQTQGTMYAEVDVRNLSNNSRIIAIGDGTSNNRIIFIFTTSSRFRLLVSVGGNPEVDLIGSSQAAGIFKIAVAYKENDYAFYINGSQVGTDTSALVPACSQVILGKTETSSNLFQLNDRILSAALYTTRLTNTQLALLTSPYTSYSSMASALSYTLG